MEDPDMSCMIGLPTQSLTCSLIDLGAVTTSVGWRLPEVNIGIVCANAPVIRPLYLFFRGQLTSQKISRATAVGKEGGVSWPSDTTRLELTSPVQKEATSDGGSLEMGSQDHERAEGRREQDMPHNPLKGRPYFTWDR